jgi:hypothetical protein|tara:strand:+ start:2922 stop:3308 length:387 start_codon:yes stop_codon:yes gene_type:complete
MKIECPISAGELLDKISILKIKKQKINDLNKQFNIKHELNSLLTILDSLDYDEKEVKGFLIKLEKVNTILWNVEDNLRELEKNKKFDTSFVELARKVYLLNDERFSYKNQVNAFFNSEIIETKSYKKY